MTDELPFELETELERRIAAEPEWREGVEWGEARRGHPEGAVKHHIADVLANLDREAISPDDRRRLRLAALVHDTFKFRAPEASARVGSEGHHGSHAARFLARFVDDEELLEIVRWHDEAFAAWLGFKRGERRPAEDRARALIQRLGPALPLYLRFFRADNATEGKSPESLRWLERIVRRRVRSPRAPRLSAEPRSRQPVVGSERPIS
jgi:hypothetical protein